MKKLALAAMAGILAVGAGVALWAPWASPPELVYDTVAGYPMLVYYHNIGGAAARVSGFGGVPAISVNKPLSAQEIDAHFVEARKRVVSAPDLIRPGERARFILEDPDGLAWVSAKEERPTYFYIFAVLESPRSSLVDNRWINELCLVAKTGERFMRCEGHNEVYAGR
jgi:hypothetical protein